MGKFIILSFVSLLTSLPSFSAVPQEISKLMNKLGVFISYVNGNVYKEDDGTPCQVIMNPYGGESSIAIESRAYDLPVAHLDGAKKSVEDNTVYFKTNETGKRPGGSVCGDVTPLTSYSKTVEVSGNKLIIREKMRCLLSKTEIIQGCLVK